MKHVSDCEWRDEAFEVIAGGETAGFAAVVGGVLVAGAAMFLSVTCGENRLGRTGNLVEGRYRFKYLETQVSQGLKAQGGNVIVRFSVLCMFFGGGWKISGLEDARGWIYCAKTRLLFAGEFGCSERRGTAYKRGGVEGNTLLVHAVS